MNLTSPVDLYHRLRLMYRSALQDLDLRHPDTRARRLLELQILQGHHSELPVDLSRILPDGEIRTKYSQLDWITLMEWSERFETARALLRLAPVVIEAALRTPQTFFERECVNRLTQIFSELKDLILPKDPPLHVLVTYRWTTGPLRDEALYLVHRYLNEKSQNREEGHEKT